jgi:NADH-quinone oxidoreductase subunit K
LGLLLKIKEQLVMPVLARVGELVSGFDLMAFIRGAIYFVFHLSLTHYLLLGALLFTIGLLGVMTRRNLIAIIISIELMLNAANINFLAFSQYLGQSSGSVMVVFVLALAAAEVAIGLAIGLAIYRKSGTIDVEQFHALRDSE